MQTTNDPQIFVLGREMSSKDVVNMLRLHRADAAVDSAKTNIYERIIKCIERAANSLSECELQ